MNMEELANRIVAVEERSKSNSHRLDEMAARLEKNESRVENIAVMAAELTRIKEDLGEVKTDVKELKEKSGKRWEMVVEKVVIAIVTGVIGFLLCKIGLG